MIQIRWTISHCILVSTILFSLAASSTAQVFVTGDRYATGALPQSIASGDFDGDADIDLAINHRDVYEIWIYLNDGLGAFDSIQVLDVYCDRKVTAADLNNDGLADLLFYGADLVTSGWGIGTFINQGDTTFDPIWLDTLGSRYLCAADFDGDQLTDIATYNALDSTGIWIFYGSGGGTFEAPVMIRPIANRPGVFSWVGTVDLDADGDFDLLYTDSGRTHSLLNNGAGGFAEAIEAGAVLGGQTFAYLNDDIYPDMVGTGIYACSSIPTFMLGNGDGTFGDEHTAWITAGMTSGGNAIAADFSSNGTGDIAFSGGGMSAIVIGLNDGRCSFGTHDSLTAVMAAVPCMVAGDFDSDGDPDLAAAGADDSLTILFSLGAQHANRILVPDDVPTIQGAIESAWNLDTVVVQPGTFVENIDFGGKNIRLLSEYYYMTEIQGGTWKRPDSTTETVLDGGGTGRVLTFDDFEDDRSVVAGFTIQNGGGEGLGGGIYCYDTACPTIIHNIIRNNHAISGGGGLFLHQGPTTVKYNLIVNNSSGNWGGGIFSSSYDATIMNNTVYGNTATQGGGGLYFNYGDPFVCNNIFWGNVSDSGGNQFNDEAIVSFVVTYSLVEDGWPGEGNFDADPMFVDPVNGDFRLLAGSPCIDAGDPGGPTDPDGSTADLGAICYLNPTAIGDGDNRTGLPTAYALAQNYPNPFNPETVIEYTLAREGSVRLEVFNVLGRRVRTLVDRRQPAGSYTITWDGRTGGQQAVGTGVYFYRLQADDFTASKKMLLVK